MKSECSFGSAFRRAATFFPSAAVTVEGPLGVLKASSFCPVSFEPPIIGVTFSRSLPVFPDGEFRVSAMPAGAGSPLPVTLHCRAMEMREVGDHALLLAGVERAEIRGGPPAVNWRRASFALALDYPFLACEKTLEAFVADWRSGVLPKKAWTHAAHVGVTGYYAFENSPEAVVTEMKRGILDFNAATGTVNGPDCGYHETLTQFWSDTISRFVRSSAPASRLEAVVCAVRRFGEDRDLASLYYSFDVVRDRRARREWVRPDREPLAEWCGR
jgi:hypothetical protein